MSEATLCNFCTLRSMTATATQHNTSVVMKANDHGWIDARYDDKPDEPVAAFLALTDRCVC